MEHERRPLRAVPLQLDAIQQIRPVVLHGATSEPAIGHHERGGLVGGAAHPFVELVILERGRDIGRCLAPGRLLRWRSW
jgi:hypothetical protein